MLKSVNQLLNILLSASSVQGVAVEWKRSYVTPFLFIREINHVRMEKSNM